MIRFTRRALASTLAAAVALPVVADDGAEIEAKVDIALSQLFASTPGAEELAQQAKGVLVMPDIVKGGLVFGGAYGEGALRVNGATEAYYSFIAASFGLQAGVQSTKQALFFLTDEALNGFRNADGFELGADAEVTFPGAGLQTGLDTTQERAPIVGFVFGQDGLLAGASIEGGKYSRITR